MILTCMSNASCEGETKAEFEMIKFGINISKYCDWSSFELRFVFSTYLNKLGIYYVKKCRECNASYFALHVFISKSVLSLPLHFSAFIEQSEHSVKFLSFILYILLHISAYYASFQVYKRLFLDIKHSSHCLSIPTRRWYLWH